MLKGLLETLEGKYIKLSDYDDDSRGFSHDDIAIRVSNKFIKPNDGQFNLTSKLVTITSKEVNITTMLDSKQFTQEQLSNLYSFCKSIIVLFTDYKAITVTKGIMIEYQTEQEKAEENKKPEAAKNAVKAAIAAQAVIAPEIAEIAAFESWNFPA